MNWFFTLEKHFKSICLGVFMIEKDKNSKPVGIGKYE